GGGGGSGAGLAELMEKTRSLIARVEALGVGTPRPSPANVPPSSSGDASSAATTAPPISTATATPDAGSSEPQQGEKIETTPAGDTAR
ncbi:unnamed protein product, partial [Laminaria digitata]